MTRRSTTSGRHALNQRANGAGAVGRETSSSLNNTVAYFTITEDCHGED